MTQEKPTAKSWFQLFLGLLSIYLFIAIVLPFLSNLPMSREAIEVIEEREIDPRALFYTESEQAVEAGWEMEKGEWARGRSGDGKTE